jgi:hypothetical protein
MSSFNPLEEKGMPLEKQFRNWSELNVTPYDKDNVEAYTQTRVITMNGIEVESVFHSHQFARHCPDNDIRRQLAAVRRVEQQQQKAVNWLTPGNASNLEVTIGYEQVAVDLTAGVAQQEPDPYLKQVYEFGLLEDFDHLYRYADLMELLENKKAEKIVDSLTEVMPGRPTIFEHRHPYDDIRRPMDGRAADSVSVLNALTILSAEQQTMNFYMNVGNRPTEPLARALYLEIAQIEEQHVSHYESILDPNMSWFEGLVWHEYNECYLYHSFMNQEPDARIRRIWELHLFMEIEHLRLACELMKQQEKRDPAEFLPKSLPEPIVFKSNKEFVRQVLANQVDLTANFEDFVPMEQAPDRYHQYQNIVNGNGLVPSEAVIDEIVRQKGRDYRVEVEGPHPVQKFRLETALQGRGK